ncbi:DUF1737 domain-containing protein (plasmid) [Pseudoalteromonas sp. T1lg65]|uniref:DUF1737 domain-containing protein n=1 Tax=Pseudoalteromonas sp. T1lg65 TaxID=2077101 RepID=UPI003F7AFCDF
MRVSESLNNGWQLYGSSTLTFNRNTPIAGQALVKDVPDETFSQDIDLRSS